MICLRSRSSCHLRWAPCDLERAGVPEEVVVVAVGERREVVAEVAVARLDIQLVAQVPFHSPFQTQLPESCL